MAKPDLSRVLVSGDYLMTCSVTAAECRCIVSNVHVTGETAHEKWKILEQIPLKIQGSFWTIFSFRISHWIITFSCRTSQSEIELDKFLAILIPRIPRNLSTSMLI